MKFLSYPVRNLINQNNLFGANAAQYAALGQKGHPGNDFEAPTGTKIFAPCDGMAVYATDSLGGDGIWILTTDPVGQNYNIILWHMPTPADPAPPGVTSAKDYPFQIPTDRTFTRVKRGDFLGYSDDSGFHPAPAASESTGPHLHAGAQLADAKWAGLNTNNGFLGCVDIGELWDGTYAEDYNAAEFALKEQVVQKSAAVVTAIATATDAQISHQAKLTLLQQIEEFLKKL